MRSQKDKLTVRAMLLLPMFHSLIVGGWGVFDTKPTSIDEWLGDVSWAFGWFALFVGGLFLWSLVKPQFWTILTASLFYIFGLVLAGVGALSQGNVQVFCLYLAFAFSMAIKTGVAGAWLHSNS